MAQAEGRGGGSSGRRPSRWVLVGLALLGAAAVVVGLLLLLLPGNSAGFGWYAYAPLSKTTFIPSEALLTPLSQTGLIVGVVGLVLLAFSAGWALGRRGPQSQPEQRSQREQ